MRPKISLILIILLVRFSSAFADILSIDSNQKDLQKILAAPQVIVDDYTLSKDELTTLYQARDYKPIWSFSGDDNKKAFVDFINSLEQIIAYHGLASDDYALSLLRQLATFTTSADQEKLDLLTTDTLLQLAHDLHGDTLNLDDLYPGWNFHRRDVDIPKSLAVAIASNTMNDFIEGLAPQHEAYRQLAMLLRSYRELLNRGGWKRIDAGNTLRPNDHGQRVLQLRLRLAAEGYLPELKENPADNQVYDQELKNAVALYQQRHGLDPDGSLGAKTLADLNVPVIKRINQIRANMERWRHMPESWPPDRYALVNIASATVTIIADRKIVYAGPVIVGRVDRKTPFIQSTIRSMIVNPFWHVPTKILREDIIPKLRQDPHYLEKLGFVISDKDDNRSRSIPDWKSIEDNEFDFHLRQSPGVQNSLGRLKFDFNNDFAVYMHGTPHQELFKKYERDLSSGCVRLRDPDRVAEILLAPNGDNWSLQHIEDAIASNKTRWVGLAQPMPIYFVYWTVFSDDNNQMNFRNDAYDYDSFLIENMSGKSQDPPEPKSP